MHEVPLSSLKAGSEATIVGLTPAAAGPDHDLVLRLIEIGFLPGERVRVIACAAPGGEPMAVKLGHTTFALRRFEAQRVRVKARVPA